MNKKLWIFSLAAAVVITSAITLTVCRRKAKHQKRLAIVSDAGYETAWDVHFPPLSPKGGFKRARRT